MAKRDRAYRKFKRVRSDVNWVHFKTSRNRCNQMIRNAKRRHIINNVSSSSPANVWRFLKTLGIGSVRQEFPKNILLDDINRNFSVTQTLEDHIIDITLRVLENLPRPNINSFKFSRVTPSEIKTTILSITSNAEGFDNISRRMITIILEDILPIVCHILNFSLESCQFPTLWRNAYVIPLPKIPNPSLPNHFRPISILPFLSKVLEACVHKQLSCFVHQNDILSPLQSGFKPGHSTASALLKVTSDVRNGIENTKLTLLVLVDFSNAFSTVNHKILMSIL